MHRMPLTAILALTACSATPPPARIVASPEEAELHFAKEGLHLHPQKNILRAWENTFAIVNQGVAAISLVKKTTIGSKTYLVFLTARHVVKAAKIQPGEAVSGQGFYLAIGRQLIRDPGRMELRERISGKIVWVKSHPTYDLAVFAVEAANLLPNLHPLTLNPDAAACHDDEGAKHYIIGFPAVNARKSFDQKVPLDKPDTITKRWSEGAYTHEITKDGASGSTADCLQGCSGGPVLDKDGHLTGVLIAGDPVADRTRKFVGRDSATNPKFHSLVIGCQNLRPFLRAAEQEFSAWLGRGA